MAKTARKQKVVIKGTKDGLLLFLDDMCSFSELTEELERKLLAHHKVNEDDPIVQVKIHTGNRLLTKEQQKRIKNLVLAKNKLEIEAIESNVILKSEAEMDKIKSSVQVVTKMVRSGQILKVTGDLLLIGDVNPGGKVMASGNIFVLGSLKGLAHAGCEGDEKAVICAADMRPSQLKIADCLNRSPGYDGNLRSESECAFINDEKQMVIDRLVVLKSIRPNLNRFVEEGF